MSIKYDNFVKALEALCKEHCVALVAGVDAAMSVQNLENVIGPLTYAGLLDDIVEDKVC